MWSRPIEVVDYDPAWPALFADIAAHVQSAFAEGPVAQIEHVGSTSVPGLPAKPVVDIDVVIPTRADLPDAVARLTTLGYVHQGDQGIASREAFKSPAGTPRHNLYVCAEDSPELRRHLVFRDYLRAHPDDARRYSDLKRVLAVRHVTDIDAYVNGKTDFVQAVLLKAKNILPRTAGLQKCKRPPSWAKKRFDSRLFCPRRRGIALQSTGVQPRETSSHQSDASE